MDSRGYGFSRKRSRYKREIFSRRDFTLISSALVLIPVSMVVFA
jgi:energy-coupling factor transporter transmembrane protein EcfT